MKKIRDFINGMEWDKIVFIVTIFVIVGVFLSIAISYPTTPVVEKNCDNLYPLSGIVTAVDYRKDYIVIEDFTGNLWIWEGAEDWGVKDIASMIMDDKGTDSITDDEIVKVYYSGWVE